ncbi:MAG: CPBP family intramembrane metalloprotease [Acidimicrobiia bacterium]|nr:CPBP family intramembrane metalloprotease [Acidimicrobiia bacterium]
MTNEERYPFWNYHDLALFIGAALPSMLLSILLVTVLRKIAPGSGKAAEAILVQFLGYTFWFLSLYALLRVRHGRPFWRSLAWSGSTRGIARCLIAGPLVALAAGWTGHLLGRPQADVPMMELFSDRFSIVLIGIFAVSLGPLCEELAFRGFLMPLVSRTLGSAAGIIIAAIPFAMLHGPQYGWNWSHILPVGLAGVAFGYARHATGSTGAATAMHATYNLTFLAAIIINREGIFGTW